MQQRSEQAVGHGGAVRVERLGALRWRAWSPALPNPRYGPTSGWARRRLQADLDLEWHTGRVARGQRSPR